MTRSLRLRSGQRTPATEDEPDRDHEAAGDLEAAEPFGEREQGEYGREEGWRFVYSDAEAPEEDGSEQQEPSRYASHDGAVSTTATDGPRV